MNFLKKVFTRDNAKRHLWMLIPFLAVPLWSYIAVSLLTGNWGWFQPDFSEKGILSGICVFATLSGALTGFAAFLRWYVRKYTPVFLVMGLISLIRAIPLVNLLLPAVLRSNFLADAFPLTLGDDMPIPTQFISPEFKDEAVWDGRLPWILAIPVALIKNLVIGGATFVICMLIALGLPALSPLFLFAVMAVTEYLADINMTATIAISAISVLYTVYTFILHPIISFKIDK